MNQFVNSSYKKNYHARNKVEDIDISLRFREHIKAGKAKIILAMKKLDLRAFYQ